MDKLILISGPCVIEGKDICFEIAEKIKDICSRYEEIRYIFKASYKKANRTNLNSFTGIRKEKAISILKAIGHDLNIKTMTDVHETIDCSLVARDINYLQVPAFLCRQTDLIESVSKLCKTGINIKKGQFMSPESMKFQVEKAKYFIGKYKEIFVTERGTTFGYDRLIVDMTSIPIMKKFSKVIMDCTHSTQRPNQSVGVTGGNPEMIETLALSSIAAGSDGLFIETHINPADSKSDSSCILDINKLDDIIYKALEIKKRLDSF